MKKIIIAGIVIVLIIMGIFATKSFTGNAIREQETKEFTVKAFKFGYSP